MAEFNNEKAYRSVLNNALRQQGTIMHQMPLEVLAHDTDERLVVIKQQIVLHDPEEVVTVLVANEQIPDLIKALQSRLLKKGKKSAAAPADTKFETHFWSLYPPCKRKVDKAGCLRIWNARELDEHADAIAAAVSRAAADPDWTKALGEFIPMPATWLRQARWEAPAGDAIQADTSWSRVI